jgi:hypothetical protein
MNREGGDAHETYAYDHDRGVGHGGDDGGYGDAGFRLAQPRPEHWRVRQQRSSTGFGDSDNKGSAQNNDPGKGQSNVTGDDRSDVCEDNGVCIGAINN